MIMSWYYIKSTGEPLKDLYLIPSLFMWYTPHKQDIHNGEVLATFENSDIKPVFWN